MTRKLAETVRTELFAERMLRTAEALNLAIERNIVFDDVDWKNFAKAVTEDSTRLDVYIGRLR